MMGFAEFLIEGTERTSLKGQHDILSHAYAMRAQGKNRTEIADRLGYSHQTLRRELDHPDVVADYNESEHSKKQPYIPAPKKGGRTLAKYTPETLERAYKLRKIGFSDKKIGQRLFGYSLGSENNIRKMRKNLDSPENQNHPSYHPTNDRVHDRYNPDIKPQIAQSVKELGWRAAGEKYGIMSKEKIFGIVKQYRRGGQKRKQTPSLVPISMEKNREEPGKRPLIKRTGAMPTEIAKRTAKMIAFRARAGAVSGRASIESRRKK